MKSFNTPMGELRVKVFGHASVLFEIQGKKIYADPYSEIHDFAGEAPADLILITHNHYDHYDERAFSRIETPDTDFIVSGNVGQVDGHYTVVAVSFLHVGRHRDHRCRVIQHQPSQSFRATLPSKRGGERICSRF